MNAQDFFEKQWEDAELQSAVRHLSRQCYAMCVACDDPAVVAKKIADFVAEIYPRELRAGCITSGDDDD